MTSLAFWLSFRTRPASAMAGVVIAIDPGHGGVDAGAVGEGGVLEKHWNLAVARALTARLRQAGIAVLLTRGDDSHLSRPYSVRQELLARAGLANRARSRLLISIHINVEASGRAQGPIVYYRAGDPEAYRLARALEAELAAASGFSHAPRPSHLMLLMASRMPAVIVELGFLSSRADLERLSRASYRGTLAAALAHGVILYLGLT